MSSLHVICTFHPSDVFHSVPVDMETFFSDRTSDCIDQLTPYLHRMPNGAPAGCCCFLYHLCWHGGTASPWPERSALIAKQEERTAL